MGREKAEPRVKIEISYGDLRLAVTSENAREAEEIISILLKNEEFAKVVKEFVKKEKRKVKLMGNLVKARKTRTSTLGSQLKRLMSEGFFDSPRSLNEIVNELARIGFHSSSSSVSPILLRDFVKKRILDRSEEEGLWKYYKPE